MSEQDNNAPGRKPDFIAYQVNQTGPDKSYWNRVGAAWKHQDGAGFDLKLNAHPTDGRVTLRELKDERMQSYEDQRREKAPEPRSPETDRGRGHER